MHTGELGLQSHPKDLLLEYAQNLTGKISGWAESLACDGLPSMFLPNPPKDIKKKKKKKRERKLHVHTCALAHKHTKPITIY